MVLMKQAPYSWNHHIIDLSSASAGTAISASLRPINKSRGRKSSTALIPVNLHENDAPVVATPFFCEDCEANYDTAHGSLLWPTRCKSCDILKSRWQRMQIWKEAIPRATRIKNSWRARFVTFTSRDSHLIFPRDSYHDCNYVEEHTNMLVARFRKMKRSVHFQRIALGGGAWVAECTEKEVQVIHPAGTSYQSHFDNNLDDARLDYSQTKFTAEINVKIHPHIHCVLVGPYIDIPSLSKLASKYGFDNVDVKYIGNGKGGLRRALNYLSVYLGKEQPIPRARDTFGIVRQLCKEVRLEKEEARRLIEAEKTKCQ